jgi:hypothetical protein
MRAKCRIYVEKENRLSTSYLRLLNILDFLAILMSGAYAPVVLCPGLYGRGRHDGRQRNNQPEQDNERAVRWEDDKSTVRQEAMQQPAGVIRQQEGSAVIGQ